jgi:hypothetical protein
VKKFPNERNHIVRHKILAVDWDNVKRCRAEGFSISRSWKFGG